MIGRRSGGARPIMHLLSHILPPTTTTRHARDERRRLVATSCGGAPPRAHQTVHRTAETPWRIHRSRRAFSRASASSFPGMTSERRARRFPVLRQKSNVPLGARATRRARAFAPAEGGTADPIRRLNAENGRPAFSEGVEARDDGGSERGGGEAVPRACEGSDGGRVRSVPKRLRRARRARCGGRAAGPSDRSAWNGFGFDVSRRACGDTRPVAAVPDATTTDAGTTPDAMTMPTVRQGWRECAGLWRDPAILQAR